MISFPMKKTLALLAAFALATAARSQSIPLHELVGPNNVIRDPMYGISVTYPAGWEISGASRWGKNNQENTIGFKVIWPSEARPSLYYQTTTNFARPGPSAEEIAAHFKYTAGTKAQQRIGMGMSDYQNIESSFEQTTINGRPAFRYLATYSRAGKKYYEYFIRVLGDRLMAMFFVHIPAEELELVRREVDQMAATIQVP
jgi:hypothetical protein